MLEGNWSRHGRAMVFTPPISSITLDNNGTVFNPVFNQRIDAGTVQFVTNGGFNYVFSYGAPFNAFVIPVVTLVDPVGGTVGWYLSAIGLVTFQLTIINSATGAAIVAGNNFAIDWIAIGN